MYAYDIPKEFYKMYFYNYIMIWKMYLSVIMMMLLVRMLKDSCKFNAKMFWIIFVPLCSEYDKYFV